MPKFWLKLLAAGFILAALVTALTLAKPAQAEPLAQQPTVAVPTVTGTPVGILATVNQDEEFVNVRSGPGTFYDKIGQLLPGQQIPVKGRTEGGLWLLIDYPGVPGNEGWVYSATVSLTPGELQVVEPPPTPTPAMTNTINPTLAAQFVITVAPTRLPTFTAPAPLSVPTFNASSGTSGGAGLPMGLVITILASIGVLMGLASLIRGR
ncbi:MAG: SH3 domain-containing protein [Anaerolineaceae bacterium]